MSSVVASTIDFRTVSLYKQIHILKVLTGKIVPYQLP
jgi:hypothetical protein